MASHTVLIAEPDQGLSTRLRDLLGREGYVVVEASDARQAMAALDACRAGEQFALMFLDVAQPPEGLAVLRHMATQHDATPVLALGASASTLDSALETGAQMGLLKPCDVHTLLDCVHQMVA